MTCARIALSGPTGSGKTALAKRLGFHPNIMVIEEFLQESELRGFDLDPQSYCFRLEHSIISGRGAHRIDSGSLVTVYDRTVDEDIEVFVRLHHEGGLLSTAEVSELKRLAQQSVQRVGRPELYVFLTAPIDVLADRIAAVHAPRPVQASLQRQVVLYTEWRHKVRAPILEVDTSIVDLVDFPEIASWILSTISSSLNNRDAKSGPHGIVWNFEQAR